VWKSFAIRDARKIGNPMDKYGLRELKNNDKLKMLNKTTINFGA